MKKILLLAVLLGAALLFVLVAAPAAERRSELPSRPSAATNAAPTSAASATSSATNAAPAAIDRWGVYYGRDDVALYIHTYGTLPTNFITKAQARALGWHGGPLEPYAPGKSIGGDHYGNYEGVLPRGSYRECDIDTLRRPRGAKRIVFSKDRRIYYSEDHYRSFDRLY